MRPGRGVPAEQFLDLEAHADLLPDLLEALLSVEVRSRKALGEDVEAGHVAARLKAWQSKWRSPDSNGSGQVTETIVSSKETDETRATQFEVAPEYDDKRFEILRSHAKGGLGEVFVARDNELNRKVALKEIQTEFQSDPSCRERFTREAEVTGGLEHPGIVPIYALGHYPDGRPFYAMRLIRGNSLKNAISDYHAMRESSAKSIELRRLLGCFVQVCQAIEYAHSRGVVHRDLKPSNIMLGRHGETLVVDWGLARPIDPARDRASDQYASAKSNSDDSLSTIEGKAFGTPSYMPPEQAAGRLDAVGVWSDVYCLGATLFHLLTNRPPHEGSVDSTLERIIKGDVPKPSSITDRVPKPLEAICLKAMELLPEDRYGSPEALADDINRFLADEPTKALVEPARARALRWLRKHPTLCTTVSSLLLLTVCGLLLFSTILGAKNSKLQEAYEELDQKNLVIEDSSKREKSLRRQSEKSAETAREQSQLALSTLTFTIENIQERLEGVPGTSSLRRDLLSKAMVQLESITAGSVDDEALNLNLATALHDMGYIFLRYGIDDEGETNESSIKLKPGIVAKSSSGQTDSVPIPTTGSERSAVLSGFRLFERAEELCEKVLDTNSGNTNARAILASTLVGLGQACKYQLASDSAVDCLRQALDENQIILALRPEDTDALLLATRARILLVSLLLDSGEMTSASKLLEIADTTSQQAVKLANQNNDEEVKESRLLRAQYFLALGQMEQSINASPEKSLRHLKPALAQLEELSEDFPNEVRIQLNLRSALDKIARQLKLLGKIDEALPLSQRQLDVSTELILLDETHVPSKRRLAYAHLRHADLLSSANQLGEAERNYEISLRILLPMLTSDPNFASNRRFVASCHIGLGRVKMKLNSTEEALEQFEQALVHRKSLLQITPTSLRAKRELCSIHDVLAVHYLEQKNLSSAKNAIQRSLQLRTEIAEADAGSIASQSYQAVTLSRAGEIMKAMGKMDLAELYFSKEIQLRNAIVSRDNDNLKEFQRLITAYRRIADFHFKANCRLPQSRNLIEDAITLCNSKPDYSIEDRAILTTRLAEICAQLEDGVSSVSAGEESVRLWRSIQSKDVPKRKLNLAKATVAYAENLAEFEPENSQRRVENLLLEAHETLRQLSTEVPSLDGIDRAKTTCLRALSRHYQRFSQKRERAEVIKDLEKLKQSAVESN